MLNEETISLLKKELTEGRLEQDLLQFALQTFQYDTDMERLPAWTDQIENNFYLAIREWDIKLYPTTEK